MDPSPVDYRIRPATAADLPGLLLVAGDPLIGFAHLLLLREVDGRWHAHLEEVAVLPGAGRRGVGTALVEAACRAAAELGHAELTLRTFADIPWNARGTPDSASPCWTPNLPGWLRFVSMRKGWV